MGRGDLTNGQWVRLEPLLSRGIKPGRPQLWTRRQLMDGIRWGTRSGAPWRDVPERYGPGSGSMTCFDAGSGTAPGQGSSPGSTPRRT
ncbi:transposase [Streptomyces sp. TE33382]